MFVLLKGVATEASLVVAEHPQCFFMHHSYLIGNGFIIAGHTFKYCGLGALNYLLISHLKNSFPGNEVLSGGCGVCEEQTKNQQ